MFAETLTVEIPSWLATVPPWSWIIAAVVAWYAVAGVVVRRTVRADTMKYPWDGRDVATFRALYWVISPFFLVSYPVWLILWAWSLGAVPSPWKTRTKPTPR